MTEEQGEKGKSRRYETLCAHWGENPADHQGAVVPPIYQNSLFTFPDSATRAQNYTVTLEGGPYVGGGVSQSYDYTRVTNPTTEIAEKKIAELEGGEAARCFGSGMAAVSAAILSCVKAGDHVIAPKTVYGPTRQFLMQYLARFNITLTLVEGSNLQEWADAMRPSTTLLFLESPSSVLMRQQDLRAVSVLAHRNGAVTIIDNSWATPLFQSPLEMGVDLTLHSATKYLGGHSDILAGVVVGNQERIKKLTFEEGCLLGGVLDPFAAWLLLRGLRTLPLRMERHQQNAKTLAHRLLEHPAVQEVYYPGLPNDPQKELTSKQLRGTSGLMSIALKAPGREAAFRFVDALHYFAIGCSWGGFESLALAMTPGEEPNRWLVRLHIGLEHREDLWDDLEQALIKSM